MPHLDSITLHKLSSPRLSRSLSTLETWSFGLTGHTSLIVIIPAVHHNLGLSAIYVWIPAILFGMLLNYQVKRLGSHFIDAAGGTAIYASKLLKSYPILARYTALAYFFSWSIGLSTYVTVLTDLIQENLKALDLACPGLLLKLGFTFLSFALAFSGTRALGILHLFFVIPAIGLILAFCFQGFSWLAFSPTSPGFFPMNWSSISFLDWAKWFFFINYATYGCETASFFVADSRRPEQTLRFLDIAAWLMPPVFLGGFWIVTRTVTDASLGDNPFLLLLAASQSFWGKSASLAVTFLLVANSLLTIATAVSNCPRILYQLALDKHISPVFAVVSRRGVLGPPLTLMFVLCLIGLIWGDTTRQILFSNVSWMLSIMGLHLGLWLQRGKPEVLFPRISLGILLVEIVAFLVGGFAWGWQDFLMGLLPPIGIMGIDAIIRRSSFAPLSPKWWLQRYQLRTSSEAQDSVMLQVSILIFLLCSAVVVGWLFGIQLNKTHATGDESLIVVLLMTVAFVGVAIACWTTLPQVVAMAEAREAAEHLFMVAQDAIVVVNEIGVIQQANPAIQSLFGVKSSQLLGNHLSQWLPALTQYPQEWKKRSEQKLNYKNKVKTLEVSVSDIPYQDFQEYVVILHDITKRKQAEEVLRQSEAQLREKSQQLAAQLVQSEKMSSLGQLVAGVAHEINNPVSFIYGNITYAHDYTQDLLRLLQLYQRHYPQPEPEIQNEIEAIDLDFLVQDLLKLLTSMQVGADRITQIVVSLRNFSRLDESEMKAVDIHEGIDSTLMILQHRLKAKPDFPEIQIVKEYGNLPLVECFAGRLNQVFMNLLANAIDALEEPLIMCHVSFVEDKKQRKNPQIRIHTELSDDKLVIIRIRDNGPGIPESLQHRLFDPFFTTKPVGKGTGLGLSISYQIITEKHGGKLQCFSFPGEGTEFAIAIPLHQQQHK
ncbi:ATP-binding protein [Mastigocladopsis repens]|uniref:ATP-binding protein n=1 Tax=Mastigocladopsis repens TaxID=221287 RepID=UPI0002FF292C|nr:ATP-binding protein [Mastigocladopsis repens]